MRARRRPGAKQTTAGHQRVTLRDVAARVQISPGLVSRVLNNKAGDSASPETARRVMEAAAELGYRPNAAARSLRTGRTGVVAIAYARTLEQAASEHYSQLIEGLAAVLGPHGYRPLIVTGPDSERLLQDLDDLTSTRACDAAVLWGEESEIEAQGLLLEERAVPFAVKGYHEERHARWPQIDFDHVGMTRRSVEHLAGLGCRRIAYIGFELPYLFCRKLEEGYRAAAVRLAPGSLRPGLQARVNGGNLAGAEAAMRGWLALPADERPDGLVIGGSPWVWHGAELALAALGIRIGEAPGEFPVVGITGADTSLLFGAAEAFRDTELTQLAAALGERLLLPLLSGARLEEPVVRILPPLRPVHSLDLLRYGSFSLAPRPRG